MIKLEQGAFAEILRAMADAWERGAPVPTVYFELPMKARPEDEAEALVKRLAR